jgi:hypothetical protein
MRSAATTLLAVALCLSVARSSAAGSPEMLRAFEEGRALVRQGDYELAAKKFLESIAHEPSVGAFLNLGDCYERLGRPAAARRRFLEAAALAEGNDAARATEARGRAAKLEAAVGRITWRRQPGSPPEVTVDGEAVSVQADAVVDPGVHAVAIRWSSGEARRTGVSVTAGASVAVDLDEPRKDVVLPPAPAQGVDSGPSTLQWVGIVTAVVGVAAMSAGVVFGIVAAGKRSDLSDRCPDYPRCPSGERPFVESDFDDARTSADLSTGLLAAGAVLTAAGVVLWITAPRAAAAAPPVALSPSAGRVVLRW